VASHKLSGERWKGTTHFGAVVPLLGALIGSEGGTELEMIARQMDVPMFFAMNEFGALAMSSARPATSTMKPDWAMILAQRAGITH
jgi:hypothetical protein